MLYQVMVCLCYFPYWIDWFFIESFVFIVSIVLFTWLICSFIDLIFVLKRTAINYLIQLSIYFLIFIILLNLFRYTHKTQWHFNSYSQLFISFSPNFVHFFSIHIDCFFSQSISLLKAAICVFKYHSKIILLLKTFFIDIWGRF